MRCAYLFAVYSFSIACGFGGKALPGGSHAEEALVCGHREELFALPDRAAGLEEIVIDDVIAGEARPVLAGLGPREDPHSRASRLTAGLATLDSEMREALERQRELLGRQSHSRTYEIDGRILHPRDFIRVIDALLSGRYLSDPLRAEAVAPGGSVRFTGYFSPEVEVRRQRSEEFRYPILRRPRDLEGPWPNRRAIELEGAIDASAHAVAWARHVLDVYALQLQGSGFVRFGDGTRRYLAYGGTNRYPYQSIELALARRDPSVSDLSLRGLRNWIDADPEVRDTITTFNPNYGFFRLADGEARGAAGLALSPMISVAADPKHYPLGSVLLARVPVPGSPGSFDTRLLLVQDTGGAINGSQHLDLYTGVGERALDLAEVLSTYGEVYLLSPN